ncbi:MAG: hypothetical protein IJ089_03600 [Clostridia bacterium]|nr:hypothetical protein [Clostridia bacterium]
MTEEEKRTLALYIMAQEQQRLTSSTFRDHQDAIAAANHRRIASNQAVFSSLAQQGITWQQLKKTYDDAFNEGYEAMIDHHLSYLYAGTAIAYHEAFNASPEDTVSFVSRVAAIPEEVKDRAVLIHEAKEKAGVDTTSYDDNGHAPTLRAMMTHESKATRKDKEAVARMKKTGITAGDLEYDMSPYRLSSRHSCEESACNPSSYTAVQHRGTMLPKSRTSELKMGSCGFPRSLSHL